MLGNRKGQDAKKYRSVQHAGFPELRILYIAVYMMTEKEKPRMNPRILAALLVVLPAPALAQMATPACKDVSDSNLPTDLAAWARDAEPVAAAASGSGPLAPAGKALAVRLQPAADVTFQVPPGQVRTPESPHAGILWIAVPTNGVWRLSASTGLWVDVIGPSGAVQSTAFGALAPCTSIRKVVEFPLAAGTYMVQLSGNPGADTRVMLSLKP